ncbi:MAG: DUF5343 domain-containing protein [Thiobacillus sp.]|nr:DUF5343 domain-containing protein [Thiobacillus sp.]
MPISLPYLAAPGSIKTALEKIKAAATPDRVTRDFVSTKLQIKGGTGAAILPFLKKIGFVASDGSPTDLYKRFRNHATAGAAVAEAIKLGYRELEQANEYFFDLNDRDLLALIVQVTGAEADSQTAKLTLSTLKAIKGFAKFDAETAVEEVETNGASRVEVRPVQREGLSEIQTGRLGLNLSYTINLNLPATSDQAVFNAIFRSLKEHLLSSNE